MHYISGLYKLWETTVGQAIMIAHLAMLIAQCPENTLSTFMKLPSLINEVDMTV